MSTQENATIPSQADKAESFRALHEGPEPLLLPNPWDVGSAKLLASLGFAALYAPGLTSLDEVRQVVGAVDLPVNVLAMRGGPTVSELAAADVRRVSVGGAFAMAALGALIEAARELREQGTYGYLERAAVGRSAVGVAFGG